MPTETDIGVLQLQGKEYRGLWAHTGARSPHRKQALLTLDFRLLGGRLWAAQL